MSTALFSSRNWRRIATRTERLVESGLLIRVILLAHRRSPSRMSLVTEVLRLGSEAQEALVLGGTARELRGLSPAECRRAFHTAVAAASPPVE
jgi:hypothetical protein